MQKPPTLSVVVPLYNEGEAVNALVSHLLQLPGVSEVVLADASNDPASCATLTALESKLGKDSRIRVLKCSIPNRAAQMNAGAARCLGKVLLFLHSDTRLPETAAECISSHIARGHVWGWFNVRLDGSEWVYRLIERMINIRSRLCCIATGDQAIFVRRSEFIRQRGFAEIALMEDVEFSCRLRLAERPRQITDPVLTSARRWQKSGVVRTILLMWKLRFLYWLGSNPEQLAKDYYHIR